MARKVNVLAHSGVKVLEKKPSISDNEYAEILEMIEKPYKDSQK